MNLYWSCDSFWGLGIGTPTSYVGCSGEDCEAIHPDTEESTSSAALRSEDTVASAHLEPLYGMKNFWGWFATDQGKLTLDVSADKLDRLAVCVPYTIELNMNAPRKRIKIGIQCLVRKLRHMKQEMIRKLTPTNLTNESMIALALSQSRSRLLKRITRR